MGAPATFVDMLIVGMVIAFGCTMCSDDDHAGREVASDSMESDADRAELAQITRMLVGARVGDFVQMTNFQKVADGTYSTVRSTHEVITNDMWNGLHLRDSTTSADQQVWKFRWMDLSLEQLRAREINVVGSATSHRL